MAGSCGYLLVALYVVYDLKVDAWWQRPLQSFFEPCVHASLFLPRLRTSDDAVLCLASVAVMQCTMGRYEHHFHLPCCSVG